MNKILHSASVLLLLVGSVYAIDEPVMKEGLWSIHTETSDKPGGKPVVSNRSICRSHAYDAHVQELAKTQATCEVIKQSSAGGIITSDAECTVGKSVIHTKGVVTIKDENAVHSETHSTFTPPMGSVSETSMIMDQKYVGACPAGVEPGDMIAADGTIRKAAKR